MAGSNGPTLAEFRNQVATKNGEAASLHQIEETKPTINSDSSQNKKSIEKAKPVRLNQPSKILQVKQVPSTSKNNRKTQQTATQLEASETQKLFNDVN